jgi:hypothetical protein
MDATISINIVNDVIDIVVTGAQASLTTNVSAPPVAPPAGDGISWSPADEVGEIVTQVDSLVADAGLTATDAGTVTP